MKGTPYPGYVLQVVKFRKRTWYHECDIHWALAAEAVIFWDGHGWQVDGDGL